MEDEKYLVLVKDRNYIYGLKTPSGHRELNETNKECAVRETFEETTLDFHVTSIRKISKWKSTSNFYGLKWKTVSYGYSAVVSMLKPHMEEILLHQNEEIENILFIKLNELEMRKDEISTIHYYIANYFINENIEEYVNNNITELILYDWEKHKII